MKVAFGLAGVVIATLVVLGYLVFIWWLDRYEREPLRIVALTFGWGALIGGGCSCVVNSTMQVQLVDAVGKGGSMLISTIVLAPVVEELIKGLVLVPLVMTDHFDNETDGLIYGAATGLGFASLENIVYFVGFMGSSNLGVGSMLGLMAIRTLFTAVMHCISSATLGMAVGWARHRPGAPRIVAPLVGYAVAVITHGIWNTLAIFGNVHSGFQLAGVALIAVGAVIMFGLTQWSLKREHDVIRRHLQEEAARGTLPHKHADIIPYWRQRRRDDWVPGYVDKEEYVRAATLLAFRHHQLEIAEGAKRDQYLEDIERFRGTIREHLSTDW